MCLETSTLCRWIIFRRKQTEWRHTKKKKHKENSSLFKESALLRAKELPGCCAIGINHHGARPLGSLPQGGAHRGVTMCGQYFEVNWVLSVRGNVISKEDSSYSILGPLPIPLSKIHSIPSASCTAAAAAKLRQSCPTLCDPIDGLLPGSSVPGILQARTLEWVAISSSNAWKWKVKVKSLSRVRPLATPWIAAYQAPPSMGVSRQEYWSGVPLPSPHLI